GVMLPLLPLVASLCLLKDLKMCREKTQDNERSTCQAGGGSKGQVLGNDNVEPGFPQAMMTYAIREANAPMNPVMGKAVIRIKYLTRMNPPEFHVSKDDEDPQDFIDEAYNIVCIMGFSMIEKVKFASYILKGVAQVWFEQ
ncbi:hypothetical protein MTR67_002127, partial [Solanum verrucosum]